VCLHDESLHEAAVPGNASARPSRARAGHAQPGCQGFGVRCDRMLYPSTREAPALKKHMHAPFVGAARPTKPRPRRPMLRVFSTVTVWAHRAKRHDAGCPHTAMPHPQARSQLRRDPTRGACAGGRVPVGGRPHALRRAPLGLGERGAGRRPGAGGARGRPSPAAPASRPGRQRPHYGMQCSA